MRLDQFGGRQCHPLVERYIGVVAAFEDFQKVHLRSAGVLDIMPHGEGHITDIAGPEIERARLTGRAEDAHTGLTLDIILPFIGVGVPMQFSHPARINFDQRRGNRQGNRKYARISDGAALPCGTAVVPLILSELNGPGTGAGKM